MDIAVIIPCYNEAQTIGKVVSDFRIQLPDAKVYVYDNNSTDATADIAKENGAIVIKERKQGKGFVVRSMFRQIEAECYVMVDGDDTYPAESVKELIAPILEHKADMVIGDRLSSTYFAENKRPFHNFGNVLVRTLVNRVFKNNVHDIMTGYRAFSREFVKSFPVLSNGFEIETEMTIFALDRRFTISEIIIDYRDRPSGSVSKLNTLSDGMKVLKTIVNLYKNYRPLSFFTLVATMFLLIGGILFAPVFLEYLQTGLVPRFPTLIVASSMCVISIISFFAGIILDTLRRQEKQNFELYLNLLETNRKKR